MNIALDGGKHPALSCLVARPKVHSRWVPSALLALLAAASMGEIQAQSGIEEGAAAGSAAEVPWMPEVIASADPYIFAPNYNHGRYLLDHFGGPDAADEVGVHTAQMSNGDSVVAGLVPNFGALGTCNNGTALCRLGLVRYNAQGVRVPWSNPGAYGFSGNEYIIYPASNTPARYQYIRDLKVGSDDQIYVMVDTGISLLLGSKDVEIEVFGPDGSFIPSPGGFGDNYSDYYGAQIALVSSTSMVITATGYPDQGGAFIAARRYVINANHSLSPDATWGQSGGIPNYGLVTYRAPGGYCGESQCEVTALYATAPVAAAEGNVYIGASVHIAGDNWDPIVLKISTANGSPKTEFNGTGWSRVRFDEPQSSLNDLIAGLYVYQNDVYLAAQVARNCFQGVGMARINGANGQDVGAFGSGGKIVFGGQGNGELCRFDGNQKTVPFAISATGGRIGVVGYQGFKSYLGNYYLVDPMLAVVNAVNGSVLSFDSYPVRRADGSRSGDAVLQGIYGGPLGTSPFTVSGIGRDTNAGNTLSYLTGRFIPVSADRIFASGFGSGSDQ